jgi:hypothetical protein
MGITGVPSSHKGCTSINGEVFTTGNAHQTGGGWMDVSRALFFLSLILLRSD